MKIILLQDIENLGSKYEVKEAKPGYARNYLIPKGLAKPATKKLLEWAKIQQEKQEKKAEEELKKITEIVSKLDGLEITIPVKVGLENQLYESINIQKIKESLKVQGFEINKSQIHLQNSISELGEFPIKIKFDHNLEAEIRVIVVEEK